MATCDLTLGCPWVNFKLRERRKEKMKSQDTTARRVPNSLSLTLIRDGESEALRRYQTLHVWAVLGPSTQDSWAPVHPYETACACVHMPVCMQALLGYVSVMLSQHMGKGDKDRCVWQSQGVGVSVSDWVCERDVEVACGWGWWPQDSVALSEHVAACLGKATQLGYSLCAECRGGWWQCVQGAGHWRRSSEARTWCWALGVNLPLPSPATGQGRSRTGALSLWVGLSDLSHGRGGGQPAQAMWGVAGMAQAVTHIPRCRSQTPGLAGKNSQVPPKISLSISWIPIPPGSSKGCNILSTLVSCDHSPICIYERDSMIWNTDRLCSYREICPEGQLIVQQLEEPHPDPSFWGLPESHDPEEGAAHWLHTQVRRGRRVAKVRPMVWWLRVYLELDRDLSSTCSWCDLGQAPPPLRGQTSSRAGPTLGSWTSVLFQRPSIFPEKKSYSPSN